MKLSELLCGAGAISGLEENAELEISCVASDSRRVTPGSAFVCLKGIHDDGHLHVKEAAKKGAILIVAEEPHEDVGLPTVYVENTHGALAFIWNNYYGRPSEKMDVVGITGTNGKTSTAYFMREVFRGAGYKTGLVGTVQCLAGERDITNEKHSESMGALANMTTPDPESLYGILKIMADEGVEIVFMEATSHALALRKLDAIKFKFGVFTNLTPDHLDFHGGMENYFAAKSKLFSMCEKGIINIDDPYGKRLCANAKCKVYTASSEGKDADFRADDMKDAGSDGVEYLFTSKRDIYRIKSPIPGIFTVKNTLLCASLASICGIHMTTVKDVIRGFSGISGRMERVKCHGADFSVFIDYAHTPDALENLLLSVRDFRREGERITLVFGCGGDRDRTKRAVMGEIASRLADRVFITSDNSRGEDSAEIIFDILRGVNKNAVYTAIADRREAIEQAVATAERGEIIILAGKGHEKYEIKGDVRTSFDEREIVREAVEKYHTKR